MRLKIIDLLGKTNIRNWYNFLQKSQYWSKEKQQIYQEEKLCLLVEHAYKYVPYYQKLFKRLKLKPCDIQTITDLQQLPVITRKILQKNYHELMASNHEEFNSQYRSTGGTTGMPVKYLSDYNTWSLHWALKYRAWEMSPYKIGEKVAIIGGASVVPEKTSMKRLIWNIVNSFEIFSSVSMTHSSIQQFIERIIRKRIKHIRGYASPIFLFAEYCLENKIDLKITSVITTAEVLQPYHKQIIIKAFNPVIIDSYGCADGGGNANTCKHDNGFHISIESAIWEVCDNSSSPALPNEMGELTLTSLTNYAMPLLRYQPGDVIKNFINTEICLCGRTLPRIERIVGKNTDILKFSNGRMLGGPSFPQLFRLFPLQQWQLVQNEMNSIDVNLIILDDFIISHKNKITELMEHHCGVGVKVRINLVNKIPIPISGKQRVIINKTLREI